MGVTYVGASTTATSKSVGDQNPQSTCPNSMRLFGLPYQFIESVDPRLPEISDTVGTNFVRNIIQDAPTVIFIPGKARFLPSEKNNRQGTAHALLEASTGSLDGLMNLLSDDVQDALRYYDFEESYTSYMKYVNMMCRTVAGFLDIKETMATANGNVDLTAYDWRNYRWNAKEYTSGAKATVSYSWKTALSTVRSLPGQIVNGFKGTGNVNINDLTSADQDNPNYNYKIALTNNFVQFYVDPSSGASQSMSNSTGQSQIKGMLDTTSATMKEMNFLTGTAGVNMEKMEELTTSGLDALMGANKNLGAVGTTLNQILSSTKTVVKGNNIVLPEIYQSSEYGIDYTVDIHLRAPYGNKYSVFVDVIAPLLHLIGLVVPKQASGNSYGSPFLVKAYYPGVFNCNLGIVESLQITKPSTEDAFSVDGLPTEVDVQVRIRDLYSDLSMSPSNEPTLFINNTSLIDYLATVAGLSMITPQTKNKVQTMVNAYTGSIRDVPDNALSVINDKIEKSFAGFISL